MTLQELLDAAVMDARSGRLARAEKKLRRLLAHDLASKQQGIARGVLGAVYAMAGAHKAAVHELQAAVSLAPNDANAWSNLCRSQKEIGRIDDAVRSGKRAVTIRGDFAEAYNNLGDALQARGDLDQAVESYRRALQLKPGMALAHNNLATALKGLGWLDEAIDGYREALRCKPDFALAQYNLGNALRAQGSLDKAIECYRRALELKPDFPEALNNLGAVFKEQHRFDQAVTTYEQALELKPDFAEALNNLGLALKELGRLDESIAIYHRALQIKPEFAEAYNNLGNSRLAQGQLDEAIASYQSAVRIKPSFAEAHNCLGSALKNQVRLDEAVASYERSIALENGKFEAVSGLAYTLQFNAFDYSERAKVFCQEAWSKIKAPAPRTRRRRSDSTKFLSVGILSAELKDHAIYRFLSPVLRHLDRDRMHIHIISNGRLEERVRTELAALQIPIVPIVDLSLDQARNRVRSLDLDLLIETTSWMRESGLRILSERLAPVQCHYIGFHGTSGLDTIDFFIGDEEISPTAFQRYFTERLYQLPRRWVAYQPFGELPPISAKAAEAPLTLGTFNNLAKVTPATLEYWGAAMQRMPGCKLVLKDKFCADPFTRHRISYGLQAFGVRADQIEFRQRDVSWHDHMTHYNEIDIALDTTPVNSGTTAFDALAMGVPLIAIRSDWMGGRMSSAILKSLGREGWIAESAEEFATAVERLGRETRDFVTLKNELRAQFLASELTDGHGLARALEAAFFNMIRMTEQSDGEHRQRNSSIDSETRQPLGTPDLLR